MTYDPFKDARQTVDRKQGRYSLGLARVSDAPDNADHVVVISPVSDSGIESSGPVPAEVAVENIGEVAIPSEGDLVVFGKFGNERAIVLQSVYSGDNSVREYQSGDRIIGNENGYIAIREDGSIDSSGSFGGSYSDEDAVDAINADADHGSTASHDYFSGSHADLTDVAPDDHHTKTSSASELTDVSADSVSDAHHSRYTDEEVEDAVAAALSGGTNVSITYDDANDTITVDGFSGSHNDLTDVGAEDHHSLADLASAFGSPVEVGAADLQIDSSADAEKLYDSAEGGPMPSAMFQGDTPPASRLPAGETNASFGTENVYDQNIHAQSDNSGQLTYDEAVEYAKERGGRLPTIEELEGLVTKGTGSGYDADFCWTQTHAGPEEVYTNYGSWVTQGVSDPRDSRTTLSTDGSDTAVVRWVAEVDQDGLPASVDQVEDNIFLAEGSSTNINQTTTVSWDTTTFNDSAYSWDGSSQLTIQEGGRYEIEAEVDFTSSGASRQNPNLFILQNDNIVGVGGRSGYMRDYEGHDHSSVHSHAVIEASAGDVIDVESRAEAETSGSIVPDRAMFYVKKLK